MLFPRQSIAAFASSSLIPISSSQTSRTPYRRRRNTRCTPQLPLQRLPRQTLERKARPTRGSAAASMTMARRHTRGPGRTRVRQRRRGNAGGGRHRGSSDVSQSAVHFRRGTRPRPSASRRGGGCSPCCCAARWRRSSQAKKRRRRGVVWIFGVPRVPP